MTGSGSTRLVVLRGNSGSGKSTLAAALRAARPDWTVAVVGQDLLRRTVLRIHDDVHRSAAGLVDLTARHALDLGMDVVVEGILHEPYYGAMLLDLVRDHAGRSAAYFLDVTFDETLRRHALKGDVGFGEEQMRGWWYARQLVPGLDEVLLPETATLEETAARIVAECWD